MMTSVFKALRTIQTGGAIYSWKYGLVTIGTRTDLGELVSCGGIRQVEPFVGIDSPYVYWVSGPEQGRLSIGRLVGRKGFFDGWESDEYGIIKPVSINPSEEPWLVAASAGVRFGDTIVESMSCSVQAGELEISEGVSMRCGTFCRG